MKKILASVLGLSLCVSLAHASEGNFTGPMSITTGVYVTTQASRISAPVLSTIGLSLTVSGACDLQTKNMKEYAHCLVYDTSKGVIEALKSSWDYVKNVLVPKAWELTKNPSQYTIDAGKGSSQGTTDVYNELVGKKKEEVQKAVIVAAQNDLLNIAAGNEAQILFVDQTVDLLVEKSGHTLSREEAAIEAYKAYEDLKADL